MRSARRSGMPTSTNGPLLSFAILGSIISVARASAQTSDQDQEQETTGQPAHRERFLSRAVPAPKDALELGVRAGYDQGVGSMSSAEGDTVQNFAGAGMGGRIDVGFRIAPEWSVGA